MAPAPAPGCGTRPRGRRSRTRPLPALTASVQHTGVWVFISVFLLLYMVGLGAPYGFRPGHGPGLLCTISITRLRLHRFFGMPTEKTTLSLWIVRFPRTPGYPSPPTQFIGFERSGCARRPARTQPEPLEPTSRHDLAREQHFPRKPHTTHESVRPIFT